MWMLYLIFPGTNFLNLSSAEVMWYLHVEMFYQLFLPVHPEMKNTFSDHQYTTRMYRTPHWSEHIYCSKGPLTNIGLHTDNLNKYRNSMSDSI